MITTHGTAIRLFLMRWFHWTVEQFEATRNPHNCEIFELELQENNKYKLLTPLRERELNPNLVYSWQPESEPVQMKPEYMYAMHSEDNMSVKDQWTVILNDPGETKLRLCKYLIDYLNIDLRQAHTLINSCPCELKVFDNPIMAQNFLFDLKEFGASAEIK